MIVNTFFLSIHELVLFLFTVEIELSWADGGDVSTLFGEGRGPSLRRALLYNRIPSPLRESSTEK